MPKNDRDIERAEKTEREAGSLPGGFDENAFYLVSLSRPVKFRSHMLRPEDNPHTLSGQALRIMSENEPTDAFESVEAAGENKQLARAGVDRATER